MMASHTQHPQPPLWLLPQAGDLPVLRRRRPAAAYAVNLVALLGLIPLFVYWAPRSIWQPTEVFAILLSAGFVSAAAAVEFRKYVLVDAGSAIALISVALLGPLPALVAYAAGEAVYLFREYRPGRQPFALLSNLVLVGWSTLAATLPFALAGYHPPLDTGPMACFLVLVGGTLMIVPNWLLIVTNEAINDGQNVSSLIRTAVGNFFSDSFLVVGAAAVVLGYGAVGTAALVLLAPLILVPRGVVSVMFRSRPINGLDQSGAAQRYAEVMARELGIPRDRQVIMLDAASQVGGQPQLDAVDNFQEVMQLVLYSNERWDSGEGGFPGVLSGRDIPIESRILALAREWASLTARGTRELSPEQAIHLLRASAGAQFDPVVVAAGVKVIEDELLPGTQLYEKVAGKQLLTPSGV